MFGSLFDNGRKEAKLQEARNQQQQLIAEQLKELKMEHELESQMMTQRGLINQQKLMQEQARKNVELQEQQTRANATIGASTADAFAGSSSNDNSNNKGPGHKIVQHVETAKKGYEQLVHAIVRPPRASYKISHLGPDSFTFCKRRFVRDDSTLLTERGLKIQCSHWLPEGNAHPLDFVVVYMHGNASARVEVLQQLSYWLSLGLSVCSFEFAGSGTSDGDYVSLGYYEREDLATVVAHLRARLGASVKIALWGRSMGAATALMYASREAQLPIQNVKCLILDSSFSDLVQLAEEMVGKAREQGIVVPNVVVSVALAAIGWSVQNKAKFDIKDISPVQHAPQINIPALFVCGEQDDFIKPHHSEAICAQYKGPSNMMLVQGDHNDPRPLILFSATTQFLQKHLLGDDVTDIGLEVPGGLDLQTCPWQFKSNSDVYQAHPRLATLASSSSTVDQSEIGMTKKRQEAIQSSVVTMLGHEQRNGSTANGHVDNSDCDK
jgi:pimeloyl-ACP methyl ester carboxylesterase